jgi:hypothetical protein
MQTPEGPGGIGVEADVAHEEEATEDAIERALGVRIFVVMQELSAHCEASGEDPSVIAAALANQAALLLVEEGYAQQDILRAFARSIAWANVASATALGGDA